MKYNSVIISSSSSSLFPSVTCAGKWMPSPSWQYMASRSAWRIIACMMISGYHSATPVLCVSDQKYTWLFWQTIELVSKSRGKVCWSTRIAVIYLSVIFKLPFMFSVIPLRGGKTSSSTPLSLCRTTSLERSGWAVKIVTGMVRDLANWFEKLLLPQKCQKRSSNEQMTVTELQ
jgi:hypothetical protein